MNVGCEQYNLKTENARWRLTSTDSNSSEQQCCHTSRKANEAGRNAAMFPDDDVIFLPDQSVQQHLVGDRDEFTAPEILRETAVFVTFLLLWPFLLVLDLIRALRPDKVTFTWNFLDNQELNAIPHQPAAHEAVRNGNLQHLEWFLNEGTDVDREELIFTAIQHNQLACVKLLLKHGANLCCENVDHLTPFLFFVHLGATDIAAFLLHHQPQLIHQRDSLHRRNALVLCIQGREDTFNLALIKLLVTHGADINDTPDLLLTVAHSGAENSQEVLRYFLQLGPSPELLNRTCKYRSRGSEIITCVFLQLVMKGKVESLRDILSHPVDIHVTNERNLNALDLVVQLSRTANEEHSSVCNAEVYREIELLLLVAGLQPKDPSNIQEREGSAPDITLKHLCRDTLRTCLLQCSKKQNLFEIVPRIPLPPGPIAQHLRSYLLFHQHL